MIEAYAAGTRIKIATDGPVGIIIGTCIRFSDIPIYEVAWWSGGTRYTAWMTDQEFEGPADRKLKIGFRPVSADGDK